MRVHNKLGYDEIGCEVEAAETAEIVSGHLASCRMQRRVVVICSVLGLLGIMLLGAALVSGKFEAGKQYSKATTAKQ